MDNRLRQPLPLLQQQQQKFTPRLLPMTARNRNLLPPHAITFQHQNVPPFFAQQPHQSIMRAQPPPAPLQLPPVIADTTLLACTDELVDDSVMITDSVTTPAAAAVTATATNAATVHQQQQQQQNYSSSANSSVEWNVNANNNSRSTTITTSASHSQANSSSSAVNSRASSSGGANLFAVNSPSSADAVITEQLHATNVSTLDHHQSQQQSYRPNRIISNNSGAHVVEGVFSSGGASLSMRNLSTTAGGGVVDSYGKPVRSPPSSNNALLFGGSSSNAELAELTTRRISADVSNIAGSISCNSKNSQNQDQGLDTSVMMRDIVWVTSTTAALPGTGLLVSTHTHDARKKFEASNFCWRFAQFTISGQDGTTLKVSRGPPADPLGSCTMCGVSNAYYVDTKPRLFCGVFCMWKGALKLEMDANLTSINVDVSKLPVANGRAPFKWEYFLRSRSDLMLPPIECFRTEFRPNILRTTAPELIKSVVGFSSAELKASLYGVYSQKRENIFRHGMLLKSYVPYDKRHLYLCRVIESKGFRLRLRMCYFPSNYDVWVHYESPFIFPCAFVGCTQTNDESKTTCPPAVARLEAAPLEAFPLETQSLVTSLTAASATTTTAPIITSGGVAPPLGVAVTATAAAAAAASAKINSTNNKLMLGQLVELTDSGGANRVHNASVGRIIRALPTKVLVHYVGRPDGFEEWLDCDSPRIKYCGYSQTELKRSVMPPHRWNEAQYGKFDWNKLTTAASAAEMMPKINADDSTTNFSQAEKLSFLTRQQYESMRSDKNAAINSRQTFRVNNVVEAVDPMCPRALRVCCVVGVSDYRIQLHMIGLPRELDFWLDDASDQVFPPGYAFAHGYTLTPPVPWSTRYDLSSVPSTKCTLVGCMGWGHAFGACYETHSTLNECPYAAYLCGFGLPAIAAGDETASRAPRSLEIDGAKPLTDFNTSFIEQKLSPSLLVTSTTTTNSSASSTPSERKISTKIEPANIQPAINKQQANNFAGGSQTNNLSNKAISKAKAGTTATTTSAAAARKANQKKEAQQNSFQNSVNNFAAAKSAATAAKSSSSSLSSTLPISATTAPTTTPALNRFLNNIANTIGFKKHAAEMPAATAAAPTIDKMKAAAAANVSVNAVAAATGIGRPRRRLKSKYIKFVRNKRLLETLESRFDACGCLGFSPTQLGLPRNAYVTTATDEIVNSQPTKKYKLMNNYTTTNNSNSNSNSNSGNNSTKITSPMSPADNNSQATSLSSTMNNNNADLVANAAAAAAAAAATMYADAVWHYRQRMAPPPPPRSLLDLARLDLHLHAVHGQLSDALRQQALQPRRTAAVENTVPMPFNSSIFASANDFLPNNVIKNNTFSATIDALTPAVSPPAALTLAMPSKKPPAPVSAAVAARGGGGLAQMLPANAMMNVEHILRSACAERAAKMQRMSALSVLQSAQSDIEKFLRDDDDDDDENHHQHSDIGGVISASIIADGAASTGTTSRQQVGYCLKPLNAAAFAAVAAAAASSRAMPCVTLQQESDGKPDTATSIKEHFSSSANVNHINGGVCVALPSVTPLSSSPSDVVKEVHEFFRSHHFAAAAAGSSSITPQQ